MTATVTLQDIVPDQGPGTWDTPAGSTRLYRMDVAVFTGEDPPGVSVTVRFSGSVVSGTVTLLAWRTGTASAYTYQPGAGDLTLPHVSVNGVAVSAFIEIKTDAAVLPGTPQSANLTITPVGGGPNAHAQLTGEVTPPLDQRATVNLIMDQTMADPSINVMAPAKAAAKLVLDFMRASDWAGLWYLAPDEGPTLPEAHLLTRDLTPAIRTQLKGLIDTIPSKPAGPIKADLALNRTGASLRAMTFNCVCAPPLKSQILLSCVSATATSPVAVAPSVSSYALWLGTVPSSPPAGAYTAFHVPNPSTPTNQFLLRKFLLQIVATASGIQTIFDPDGCLQGDQQGEISFDVSDADTDVRALVLTDSPELVELELKSDDHHVIPGRSKGCFRRRGDQFLEVSIERDYGQVPQHMPDCGCGRGNAHPPARHDAPDALPPPKSGKWKAVISLSKQARECGERPSRVPYSLVVFARSRLEFTASVHQDTEVIGGTAFISAELHESGVPITSDRARVVAQVTFPDGGKSKVALRETSEGRYEARVTMTRPGVTTFRIMASGRRIPHGDFQRELSYTTLTRTERECLATRERRGAADEPQLAGMELARSAESQALSVGAAAGSGALAAKPGAAAAEKAAHGESGRSLAQRLINALTTELLR